MYKLEQLWHLLKNGVRESTEKVLLGYLLKRAERSIKGTKYTLYKHPSNNDPDKVDIPEKNDIIKGYFSNTKFLEVIYSGTGDYTQLANSNIILDNEVTLYP